MPDLDLSPYRVDRKLAEGGMGVVYAAEHSVMGRKVALKVLHAHVSAQPEALARFRLEAQVLGKLEHPNAVRIFDFVADRRRPFLVMELVEGTSLAERLRVEGRLPFDAVHDIALQVLDVLQMAHTLGIIHRDLKPANLMLDATKPGHFVKVVDFGVALLQAPTGGGRLTVEGQVPGTPAYMSPEQVNAEPLDARSDLYSLACVLFELVSGKPIFESGNAVNLMSAHLFREPPLIEDVSSVKVPDAWQSVLRRALSKPRAARFESAAQMREALIAALEVVPRGPDPRTESFAGASAFVAAEIDDVPVQLLASQAPSALRETLAEALAGIGARVTHDQTEAGVVVVAEATGARSVSVGSEVRAGVRVLVCLEDDDWASINLALQKGAYDVVPLPVDGADFARRVVRALRSKRGN